ncbi:MAG: thioredoxin domain-containing protein, partial [Solirubrobacterales bacterium]|nr:thioredoxin domain-containing protein [Solirubrobacterales bacterium]
YMQAVQAMTGQGGWPLNVFITPEGVPFYGGTYFPPQGRMGMPAWPQVVMAVADAWATKRDEIRAQGERMAAHLVGSATLEPGDETPGPDVLDAAVDLLRSQYDSVQGGFGAAPKFPPSSVLELLLRRGEHGMALHTLRCMASGGIFDQVGGGFARYAVDATWTVPHFEKMLYDNALLARTYLHGFQVSGDAVLRRTCTETLDWVLREMTAPEGGFYSALDADTDGTEGLTYVWTVAELRDVLGDDAGAAIAWFGATQAGNFEGTNVLEARGPEPAAEDRARIRSRLLEARERRPQPGLDDKRLTAWNALMLGTLAEAGAALSEPRYVAAAERCAGFLLGRLRDDQGRLLRTFNAGRAHIAAFLEDHAFLVEALLDLYEATLDPRWFTAARELADTTIERFGDSERGGFFSTAADQEALVARRKDLDDNPIPSGQASAALGLLRLDALTGEARYGEAAEGVLRLLGGLVPRAPQAFGHLMQAIDFRLAPVREVALVGDDLAPLLRVVRARFRPHVVLAGGGGPNPAIPLLQGRSAVAGAPTAYVCERFACRRPVSSPEELAALLGG